VRQSLGDDAVEGRGQEEIALNAARVWCDAAAFDDALDAGRPDEAMARGRMRPMDHVRRRKPITAADAGPRVPSGPTRRARPEARERRESAARAAPAAGSSRRAPLEVRRVLVVPASSARSISISV